MTSPADSGSPELQRAIALLEEALGILDTLGLNLAAAKLAGILDMALKEQPGNGGP
jgi:hypothetical protein